MLDLPTSQSASEPELRPLFHQLNNQLGIVLAHAELLEAKAADDANSGPRRAGRHQRRSRRWALRERSAATSESSRRLAQSNQHTAAIDARPHLFHP